MCLCVFESKYGHSEAFHLEIFHSQHKHIHTNTSNIYDSFTQTHDYNDGDNDDNV